MKHSETTFEIRTKYCIQRCCGIGTQGHSGTAKGPAAVEGERALESRFHNSPRTQAMSVLNRKILMYLNGPCDLCENLQISHHFWRCGCLCFPLLWSLTDLGQLELNLPLRPYSTAAKLLVPTRLTMSLRANKRHDQTRIKTK